MLANRSPVGAFSTSLPPYITRDLVGVAGDDAEVVGDEHQRHVAVAALLAEQVEDLRLHRDVECGGRLVGEQQRRAARHGDGDHDALAHAARQLVRVLLEPSARPRGCARPAAAARPSATRVCLVMPRWICSGSAICAPIFISGFSEVIGSWKIIAISLPHTSRICLAAEVADLAALELDAALTDGAAWREQAHDRARQDGLARTALAHDAERLAAVEREADAVDRAHQAAWRLEVRAHVGELEQRPFGRRGSRPAIADRSYGGLPDVEAARQSVTDEVERQHRQEQHQAREDRRPTRPCRCRRGAASIILPHVVRPSRRRGPRNASAPSAAMRMPRPVNGDRDHRRDQVGQDLADR